MRVFQQIRAIFLKTKYIFFFNSFQKYKYLELAYRKNYFNLKEIFILKLFRMVTNETEGSSLE